jgi:two-component system copper resistance phosphate regulon response regulator CusR
MKILIIEDEAKTAKFLKRGLGEAGYVVDVASDGLDGLELAKSIDFDLIILDIMLPGLDGWQVLTGLRHAGRNTQVLFLTALDAVHERVRGFELGADDYLVKPFAFSELILKSIFSASAQREAASGLSSQPKSFFCSLCWPVVQARSSRAPSSQKQSGI